MKYKCIHTFEIEEYDNGWCQNRTISIPEGSMWEINSNENIAGGDIHLENVPNDDEWIEISESDLEKYFVRFVNAS